MEQALTYPGVPHMLPAEALTKAAACLKVMAHPMRLRLVDLLLQGDFSVRELAGLVELQEHQVCAHLRLMQGCGLLSSERRGKSVHYRVASPQLPALVEMVRRSCSAAQANSRRKTAAGSGDPALHKKRSVR